MKITDVKVFPVDEDKLKAYATITFDNSFIVRDLKVISGNKGFFIAMPSKKRKDGTFRDVAHPLNSETRKMIEDAVLEVYNREASSSATLAPYPENEEITTEPSTKPAAEPETGSETEPETEPAAEPVAEPEPETAPETEMEMDTGAEGETKPEGETNPERRDSNPVVDEEEPEKGPTENPTIEPSDDPDKAFGYEE